MWLRSIEPSFASRGDLIIVDSCGGRILTGRQRCIGGVCGNKPNPPYSCCKFKGVVESLARRISDREPMQYDGLMAFFSQRAL